VEDPDFFFQVVKAGFSQKRKQLRNSLSAGLRLNGGQADELLVRAGIDPKRRPETLTLEEWGALTRGAAAGKT
jgi:16S rRNA (adenine1518-N6/adenine1519-N6)-dimethyltransferase